jgi:hypothetical protein
MTPSEHEVSELQKWKNLHFEEEALIFRYEKTIQQIAAMCGDHRAPSNQHDTLREILRVITEMDKPTTRRKRK